MKQVIQKIVNTFGYKISKITSDSPGNPEISDYPCIDLLDLVVQNYVQQQQDVCFIQIGAHDGTSADPASKLIRRYHWSGILVEPLPSSFKELIESYQGQDQLIFEQLVIGAKDGMTSFYTVSDQVPGLPFWLSQSSSLDRDWVYGALYYWKNVRKLESIPDDLESLIEEIPVPEMTIKTLMSKHKVEKLDLLFLSTPGYDFEIMKMFPFDQIKPPIICFEYLCLKDRRAV